jgi:hypothetical protein
MHTTQRSNSKSNIIALIVSPINGIIVKKIWRIVKPKNVTKDWSP